MNDEDINWFEGKYPSWQDGIERSAKAAIDEIHQMAVEAMPKTQYAEMSAMERLLASIQHTATQLQPIREHGATSKS